MSRGEKERICMHPKAWLAVRLTSNLLTAAGGSHTPLRKSSAFFLGGCNLVKPPSPFPPKPLLILRRKEPMIHLGRREKSRRRLPYGGASPPQSERREKKIKISEPPTFKVLFRYATVPVLKRKGKKKRNIK